jgi:S1-C subfamily serine protease
VTRGGPADKAGLVRGDVIVELDGKRIIEAGELPRMVAFGHIGKTVTFKVMRQGKAIEVKVLVEKRPEEPAQGKNAGER